MEIQLFAFWWGGKGTKKKACWESSRNSGGGFYLNKLLTVNQTKRNENTTNVYAKDSGFEGNFFCWNGKIFRNTCFCKIKTFCL